MLSSEELCSGLSRSLDIVTKFRLNLGKSLSDWLGVCSEIRNKKRIHGTYSTNQATLDLTLEIGRDVMFLESYSWGPQPKQEERHNFCVLTRYEGVFSILNNKKGHIRLIRLEPN